MYSGTGKSVVIIMPVVWSVFTKTIVIATKNVLAIEIIRSLYLKGIQRYVDSIIEIWRTVKLKNKLLDKKDFIWKEKKTNNIESNPLEYWYTTYDNGDTSRLYYIVPQYPSIDGICINVYENPELYIYFEARGTKLSGGDYECKYSGIGNGYKYSEGSFKRAFKTIEEAKDRAYVDYKMIYGYAMSFIEDKGDTNE